MCGIRPFVSLNAPEKTIFLVPYFAMLQMKRALQHRQPISALKRIG